MTAIAETIPEAVGEYDVRVPAIEKALYREITDDLIDADARVFSGEGYHGVPCWDLYRCAIARDFTTYARLRAWMVAFAFAYAACGGLRADAHDDCLIAYAAWDALHFVINKRWLMPVRDVAPNSGSRRGVYGRFRKALARRALASLDAYVNELQYQLRKVVIFNKRAVPYSSGKLVTDGVSFPRRVHAGMPLLLGGDGNTVTIAEPLHD